MELIKAESFKANGIQNCLVGLEPQQVSIRYSCSAIMETSNIVALVDRYPQMIEAKVTCSNGVTYKDKQIHTFRRA